MAGGVHGRGACVARGHAWQWGMHGGGVCVAEGGMHGRGDMCGTNTPLPDTMRYGQ